MFYQGIGTDDERESKESELSAFLGDDDEIQLTKVENKRIINKAYH